MDTPLPSGWISQISRSKNCPYYINEYTGKSQWEKPTAPAEKPVEEKVQVLHLLVKHSGSRNPKSWRSPNGITKSKEAAINELMEYRNSIENSGEIEQAFRNLARKVSDCSSAQRGGDLGMFGRGQMQKPFEDASFDMQVGEMSQVVDTASGVHIILRIA